MPSDIQALLGRLNPICRRGFEMAAGLCVSRKHYSVEIEHVFLALLDLPGSDLENILTHFELERGSVREQINRSLESFESGNKQTPTLSPDVGILLEKAWLFSTLTLGKISIRTGAVLCGSLEDKALRKKLVAAAPLLKKISLAMPVEEIREIFSESVEGDESLRPEGGSSLPPAAEPPEMAPQVDQDRSVTEKSESAPASALDRFTVDLVAEARAGRLDPVFEREDEIRQVIDILTRRRQNNPILVGDAGVGKTAVAEGFALLVAVGDVPEGLRGISLRVLDLGLLEAGASLKGEYEGRLRAVITEVQDAQGEVILFVDEAHNLIGSGGSEGRGDAANLLKPALAAGQLRTIAATTWSEYKRYFEKDPALARRFQAVKIEEPEEEAAVSMLRGVVSTLEEHHGVRILDAAVIDAVRLSQRFIPDRKLPAKAISVLDTAAARVALAQQSRPTAIEKLSQRIRRLDREMESLEREARTNHRASGRMATLQKEVDQLTEERLVLEKRWEQERQLVFAIAEHQAELERLTSETADDSPDIETQAERLAQLEKDLEELQGEDILVPGACSSRVVAEVVSSWTGIPVGRMLRDEIDILLTLPERISQRIVGQPEAIEIISRHVQTARAGLEDPRKPKGVFLLAGPTGVGKTESALALADLLYGGERNLVTLHMSEFQEAHSVATLKGAPPGYVGYGTGGLLTEAVRRKPYCVLLLDEVEKAHADVLEIFFQVFDKGVLEDGEGIPVDFKHAIILLTTNLGGDLVQQACDSAEEGRPAAEELTDQLRPLLLERLSAPLLSRLEIVPYYPLGRNEIREIVRLKLEAIQERIRRTYRAEFTFEEALLEAVADRCAESDSGARKVEYILNRTLLPELSAKILKRMSDQESLSDVRIFLDENGQLV